MKHITVFSLILVIFFSLVTGDRRALAQSAARGLPAGKPEEVGMSSERLGRIRVAMQRYVDRGLVPGVVTLVARRGRVVHFEAIGYREVETKAPVTTDTIFRLASMTKPIASVALMLLSAKIADQITNMPRVIRRAFRRIISFLLSLVLRSWFRLYRLAARLVVIVSGLASSMMA